MKPKEFVESWKPISSEQVARLVGRSKATVDHWLVDPDKPSHQTTPKEIEDLLSTIHVIWTMQLLIKDKLPKRHSRIFEEIMEERED